MGRQSDEALQLADADELVNYLMGAHCAYMQWRELTYYLTDANDIYWRAQDTNELNDKGHFPDCSELVASVREFVDLPFLDEKHSIREVFPGAGYACSRCLAGFVRGECLLHCLQCGVSFLVGLRSRLSI